MLVQFSERVDGTFPITGSLEEKSINVEASKAHGTWLSVQRANYEATAASGCKW